MTSKAQKPPKAKTATAPAVPQPETLPTLFIIAAANAMISSDSVLDPERVERDLESVAPEVRRIVGRRGLIDRDRDLVLSAANMSDDDIKRVVARETFDDALICRIHLDGVYAGLHHGLVAGYLIAQMLNGEKGGAQ